MTALETKDLSGQALGWAVIKASGESAGDEHPLQIAGEPRCIIPMAAIVMQQDQGATDSVYAMPHVVERLIVELIEELKIDLSPPRDEREVWSAQPQNGVKAIDGESMLIAAGRAAVYTVIGANIDVPDELVGESRLSISHLESVRREARDGGLLMERRRRRAAESSGV